MFECNPCPSISSNHQKLSLFCKYVHEFLIIPTPVAKVLLIQWAEMPVERWQCIELFSGCGNVSNCFRRAGKVVASFDKILGGRAMDITKSAGFLFGTRITLIIYIVCVHALHIIYHHFTCLVLWYRNIHVPDIIWFCELAIEVGSVAASWGRQVMNYFFGLSKHMNLIQHPISR